MSKSIDLTGQRFGRLVAVEISSRANNGGLRWRCVCDCGKEKIVMSQNLRNNHVRSCGCFNSERKAELIRERHQSRGHEIHGDTGSRLYRIWIGMKTRCYEPNHHTYPPYGGRGIIVCDEWRNSFIAFRVWSFANGYSDDLSIDRINGNGNYEPNNCRWATRSIQGHNQSIDKSNTSGHVGVSFNKQQSKYVAYIKKDNHHYWLGAHDTYESACAARDKAELELYGQRHPIL